MAVVCLSWWPLSPWLSPAAAWFIFVNAVVAAIAVMSWGQTPQTGHASPRRTLRRSASSMVLDRLRSFSIFSTASDTTGVPLDGDGAGVSDSDYNCYCWPEAEAPAPATRITPVCSPAPETPRPTTPGVVTEENETAACTAPPRAPATTAQAEDDAVAAAASAASQSEGEHGADAEEEQDTSISMDEAYALVQRRRSQQPPSPPASVAAAAEANAAPARPVKGEAAKATKRRRRVRGCERGAEEVLKGNKAELNARAELFIRQFREELKLQRLNSILSHTHAISPRASAPAAAAR